MIDKQIDDTQVKRVVPMGVQEILGDGLEWDLFLILFLRAVTSTRLVETKMGKILLERGQCVFSLRELAGRQKIDKETVKIAISNIQRLIPVDTQSAGPKGTVITFLDFDEMESYKYY